MRYFVLAVSFLVLPWGFCFCREVFGFAVRYFVFAVRFLVLPWQMWATVLVCYTAVFSVVTTLKTACSRLPDVLNAKKHFWELSVVLYGLVTISVETFCTNNYPALTSFMPNNDLNLKVSSCHCRNLCMVWASISFSIPLTVFYEITYDWVYSRLSSFKLKWSLVNGLIRSVTGYATECK